jgi:hypothetical protein
VGTFKDGDALCLNLVVEGVEVGGDGGGALLGR